MAKKKLSKEHPLTTFRKTNEARDVVVKASMKKMQTGGSTAKKPTYSSNSYSKKSYVDPTSRDRYTNTYSADKKGVVRSKRLGLENATTIGGKNTVSLPETNTSMDTTGYSKGKSTFTIKQLKTNSTDGGYNPNTGGFGSSSYSKKEIPRSQVKAQIAKMKKGTGMVKKEVAAKKKTKK
jgi:hypothetical protein